MRMLIGMLTCLLGPLVFAQNIEVRTVYGEDGRKDFYELRSERLRTLARKSVALVPTRYIPKTKSRSKSFRGDRYGSYFRMCADEKYVDQPSVAMCSGVLIGSRHVLTAAHCIREATCPKMSFVFDYFIDDEALQSEVSVDLKNIYLCSKIAQRVARGGLEFAVVELDRPVQDRRSISMKADVEPTGSMLTIGYPQGIPMKVAFNGQLRKETRNYFIADLDVLSGNSGSPVFNSSYELAGILLRGEKDYEFDRSGDCYRERHCEDNACSGETVLKTSAILEYLEPALLTQM